MPRWRDSVFHGPTSTRTTPRILVVLAAVLLAARVIVAFVEKQPDPAARLEAGAGSTELVHWVSADSAEVLSRESGKPILYDFAAAWCGPCKIMKREVFSDADAAAWINEAFVPVRVIDRMVEDRKNSPVVEALQKKYGVKAFPTLVVAPVDSAEATILQGYGGKDETLQSLRAAASR